MKPSYDATFPTSSHPRMAIEERAKQFAPFAALKGYEDALQEVREAAEHGTSSRKHIGILGGKLVCLAEGQHLAVIYRNEDGENQKLEGILESIDEEKEQLLLDSHRVDLRDIVSFIA